MNPKDLEDQKSILWEKPRRCEVTSREYDRKKDCFAKEVTTKKGYRSRGGPGGKK